MSEKVREDATETARVRDADGISSRRRPILGDETPSHAVVSAVANAEDEDVTALPPLDDSIDAHHLDRLLAEDTEPTGVGLVFTRSVEMDNDVEVSFQYAGYDVTVSENHVLLE